MKWNKLSMADRAKYIQLGVKNGVYNLSDIRNTYNSYAKGGYLDWISKVKEWRPGISEDIDAEQPTYDYEGFFMEDPERAWRMLNGDPEAHFIDKYKKPNHPTFSDESIYSTPETPGGHWHENYGNSGRWVYEPSEYTKKNIEETRRYLEGSGEGYLDGLNAVFPLETIHSGNKFDEGGNKARFGKGYSIIDKNTGKVLGHANTVEYATQLGTNMTGKAPEFMNDGKSLSTPGIFVPEDQEEGTAIAVAKALSKDKNNTVRYNGRDVIMTDDNMRYVSNLSKSDTDIHKGYGDRALADLALGEGVGALMALSGGTAPLATLTGLIGGTTGSMMWDDTYNYATGRNWNKDVHKGIDWYNSKVPNYLQLDDIQRNILEPMFNPGGAAGGIAGFNVGKVGDNLIDNVVRQLPTIYNTISNHMPRRLPKGSKYRYRVVSDLENSGDAQRAISDANSTGIIRSNPEGTWVANGERQHYIGPYFSDQLPPGIDNTSKVIIGDITDPNIQWMEIAPHETRFRLTRGTSQYTPLYKGVPNTAPTSSFKYYTRGKNFLTKNFWFENDFQPAELPNVDPFNYGKGSDNMIHMDFGDYKGFTNNGAYINNRIYYPGTAPEGQRPFLWFNKSKPYTTGIGGKPYTRALVVDADNVHGLEQVVKMNEPVGQYRPGKKGFVLKSEYVTPSPIDIELSGAALFNIDPLTGHITLVN